MILKIGFIGVDSILFDDDPNIKLFEESKEFIKKAVEPHQIVFSEGIFIDRPESQRELINLIEKWEEVRLDLIIVQSVGFNTTSISPLDVALSQKNVPIVLWALPEPEFKKDASLQKGSWCGINMQAFNLKRVGVKYEYIYGLPGNEILLKIKEILKVFEVIKKLRKSTIGAIGSRPPGYYDASLDELSLRKALGIRFEVFDLAEVFSNFESISRKEIEEVSKQLYPINKTDIDTYIENSTKLYISIKKLVKEYDLAALTVKCWPDMERLLKIIPCSVVGALGNLNIPTSCEGDMLGAVSMLIFHYFNNDVTSLMDILDFYYNDNTFLTWHCGSCPTRMALNKSNVEYRRQAYAETHPGISQEFALKTGQCGILRLSEDNIYKAKYRMLFADGEGIEGPNFYKGNSLKVKLNGSVKTFSETIIREGFEHHWAFGYNINKNLLLKFCDWTNIDTIFI